MSRTLWKICLVLTAAALPAAAIEIVTDDPNARCEYVEFFDELKVYRDTSLFLPELKQQLKDRKHVPRRIDDIVRARLKGKVAIITLRRPHEFKGFGAITRLYEAADPRLKARRGRRSNLVRDIQVCSDGADNSVLGFVLEEDFKNAQVYHQKEATLPPSIYPNPIPVWREGPTDTSR